MNKGYIRRFLEWYLLKHYILSCLILFLGTAAYPFYFIGRIMNPSQETMESTPDFPCGTPSIFDRLFGSSLLFQPGWLFFLFFIYSGGLAISSWIHFKRNDFGKWLVQGLCLTYSALIIVLYLYMYLYAVLCPLRL